jgi:restriction system protein
MEVDRWQAESIPGHPDLLRQIESRFGDGTRLGVIYGAPRIGKTSLARSFAATDAAAFPGGVLDIKAASDVLRLLEPPSFEPHLLVVEGGDRLSERAISDIERYLRKHRVSKVLITVQRVPNLSFVPRFELELVGFTLIDVGRVVREVMGDVPDHYIEKLWRRTAGHPFAIINSIRLVDQNHLTWDELFAYFNNFASPGILGPDGRPASRTAQAAIFRDIRFVNEGLIERVSQEPAVLYSVSPRTFEQIVAELLSRQGYDVQLTPPSKDGGFDMYAAKRDGLGEFLFLVECKQYAPEHRVGVHVVRSLHGVLSVERATAAAVVTTSYFTRGAREFQSKVEHELKLHDYIGLRKWLEGGRKVAG